MTRFRSSSVEQLGPDGLRWNLDAHSAALMVNDDRIIANTAIMLPALREDPELLS